LYNKAMNEKNYTDALKYINLVIDKSPKDDWAYLYRSETYRLMGRIDDAFDNVQKAIIVNDKNFESYNHAAVLYESVQDYDKAIKFYSLAAEMAPDSIKRIYIINRGVAKSKIRKFDDAYTDFMYVYQTDSTDIALLNNLSAILDDMGKGDESLRLLQKMILIDSTFIGSYINLGFRYSQKKEYKKSIEYFNKALQLEPNEPLTYNNRGFSKYNLNDLDGALSDVNRSIELYPGNSYAYKNRALIYIAKGRVNMACEDIEKALTQGFTVNYGDEVEKLKAQYCK